MSSAEQLDPRRGWFKGLVAMMVADGSIDQSEMNVLTLQGQKLGLTDHEMEEILANPEEISFSPPTNSDQRFSHLCDLVMMMLADGRIDERERQVCDRVARSLGFPAAVVPRIVLETINKLRAGETREQIRDNIAAYLA